MDTARQKAAHAGARREELLNLIRDSERGRTRDELFASFKVVGNKQDMQRVLDALMHLQREGKITIKDGVYVARTGRQARGW